MNICVLSDQKQNLFCCYKIAKLTNNNFFVKNDGNCYEFLLEVNKQMQTVNFWTQYNGKQNNCYILMVKEENPQIFSNKIMGAIKNIKNVDPEYKCLLLVNLYDTEPKFKLKCIEPYVFACCHNIHSIMLNLHDDEHVFKMLNLVFDMFYDRKIFPE
jgi:hypothetical protein